MTNALSLAVRLGSLAVDDLRKNVAARHANVSNVHDYFDLAEVFLDEKSIHNALSPLPRRTLAVLAALAAHDEAAGAAEVDERIRSWGGQPPADTAARLDLLAHLLLIVPEGDRYAVYDAVRDQLAAWPAEGLPSGPELAAQVPPFTVTAVEEVEPGAAARLSGERGFSAIYAITQIVRALSSHPARELHKGGLALPDIRRLANATGVDADDVNLLIWFCDQAGLIEQSDGWWIPTEASGEWVREPTVSRWELLAGAWLRRMSPDARHLLRSREHVRWDPQLHGFAQWLFPAAHQHLKRRVKRFSAVAEFLGVTVDKYLSPAGLVLLRDGASAASAAIAEHFPAEVENVYIQHDLTVVAPGPLDPHIDTQLNLVADEESHALASTFRISTASLSRALAHGLSASQIHDFLESISLTGVPQPVEYMIQETSRRYGKVQVTHPTPHQFAGRTRAVVRSDDDVLLASIKVDKALTTLQFSAPHDGELLSPYDPEIVHQALLEARYPAVYRAPHGQAPSKRPPDPASDLAAAVADMLARIEPTRPPSEAEAARQWMSRQLEAAIRAHQTLVITVALPDGSHHDYTLDPTGIGGGRLRGRDRVRDLERTVPVSSIQKIRVVRGR